MSVENAVETPTTESATPETAAPKRPFSLLAAEKFGSAFHGEIPKEEPKAAQEAPPEAETEAAEAPVTEEVTPAEEDVADLIRQHLLADPTLLTKIKLATKIDGEAGEASLDDFVRSYQIQTAAEKRLEDSKAKSKEILDAASAQSAEIGATFAQAAKLVQKLEGKLAKDIASWNMDQLRRDDPAEWGARMTEIRERKAEIEADKREAVNEYNEATKKAQEHAKKLFREHLAAEANVLRTKIPEWGTETTAKAGQAKLRDYLAARGYTPQEIETIPDHRFVLMARDAMLYQEQQANTNAAKKRLAEVPKVLKPGAPKPSDQVNKERVDKLKAKLRKTGSLDDAFAFLQAKRAKGK